MNVSLVRMPWSQFVGGAAIAVDIGPEEDAEAAALVREVTRHLAYGIACVWLRAVPWSSPWWNATAWALQHLRQRQDIGVPLVSTHRPDEPEWLEGDFYWVMDPSHLLAEETTPAALAKAVADLPLFPTVDELMLQHPHPINISPPVLDALAYHYRPSNLPCRLVLPAATIAAAELETEEAEAPNLIKVLARCETPWAVVPG
jgi:hypothetical protein